MIQTQRRGLQYADNICNETLTFNSDSTWTVSAGTGTAGIETTNYFEGKGSLLINNNDVVNDITVSNSTHDTIIGQNGVYGVSMYLSKKEALQAITGNVKIFKNAALLQTETFTIGSDDADEDINSEWVSFVFENSYTFAKGDIISFTFTIDGIPGSGLVTLGLSIDGFMIYNKQRIQTTPPIYTPPRSDLENESLDYRVIVNQNNVSETLGGTIDAEKEYFIDGIVDISNTEINILGAGINIKGYDFKISKILSTEDNYTLFNGVATGDVFIQNVSIDISGTDSKVYDITANTGNEAIEIISVNYDNCTSLGEINGYRQGLEEGTGRFGGAPELTLSGTWLGGFVISTSIVRSLDSGSYSLFKAGTAFEMASRFKTDLNVDLPTGASLCDFSTSNFMNSNTLQLEDCIVTRNGDFDANDSLLTPNITKSDLPCLWRNNTGLPNTFIGGNMSITTETETVISSIGVFVDLAGTYTTNDLEHFDSPSNGQLRHLGVSPIEFKVVISGVLDSADGDEIDLKIVVWDDSASVFVDYKTQRRVVNNLQGGRDVAFFNMQDNIFLNTNDYVKFQVANDTSTSNITAELSTEFTIEER